MKELTIEEKVKRYDEAKEKAAALYKASEPMSGCNVIIETLFPELAESEGEKVRKALIDFFGKSAKYGGQTNGVYDKDILAWLERQGEQIDTANKEYWRGYREGKKLILDKYAETEKQNGQDILKDAILDGNEDGLIAETIRYKHEKQSEQKSDKVEDEEYNGEDYGIDSLYHAQRILEKTLGKVDGYQTDDGILSHKCAITAVKKLYEQKPAWSEEDEELLKWSINNFTELKDRFGEEYGKVGKCIDWVKSLKDRVQPQPKQEWSEEDEINVYNIIHFLEEPSMLENNEPCKKIVIAWLKSLRPQNR